jgi:hypothetical protein
MNLIAAYTSMHFRSLIWPYIVQKEDFFPPRKEDKFDLSTKEDKFGGRG